MATSKASTAKKSTKKTTTTKTNKTASQKRGSKTTKKAKTPVKQPAYIPTENDIKLRNEIKLLIALAVTALIFISNFGWLPPLGDYISHFMFGFFGVISYILPVVAFLGIAFLISNIKNPKGVTKFIAGTVFVLLTSAIIQLVFKGYDKGVSAFAYYDICGNGKDGGGFFGALIVNALGSTVGIVGAYFIIILLIIIALVLMTEKSFIGGVKKGSSKVYSHAREDVTRIKDGVVNKVEDKQYEKKRRVHKKVKGVSMQRLSDKEEDMQDMHEITNVYAGKLPEHAHLYRGHVDVDRYVGESADNIRKQKPHEQISEKSENEELSYEGFSYDGVSNEVSHEKEHRVLEHEETVPKKIEVKKQDEEVYEDEEGFFKPKERIIVSEQARAQMQRKPYGLGENKTVQKQAEGNRASGNVSESPVVNKSKKYVLPPTSLLNAGNSAGTGVNELELRDTAKKLKNILSNFGISAEVVDYSKGPSVTRYEIQPEIGTRLANITKLSDDIKLHLAATDIRIEPIPGKSTIGIEVPNEKRESVFIRELLESKELKASPSKLAFAAGKDIAGATIIGDIAKMPHLLVAGTTGSGKSVFTNSIIMSILFRATPDEVRLIIVDPKVVEFGIYNGIPHLLQPVVTDPRLASTTLKWAVAEMKKRYDNFSDYNVRDLKGYNEKVENGLKDANGNPLSKLPQIIIVIDELADLMMVAAKEVEDSICRIAQLARAAGIHLVIATQRPSVNVVTGVIKANIPSRTALMVSSGVDSRTIIDQNGAEKLLGNGDMLFYPSGYVKPVRLQGAFVSDGEVSKVVEFWKNQAKDVAYDDSIKKYVESQEAEMAQQSATSADGGDDGRDEYFFDAARFVIEKQKASTSMLQRMFKIGFNRAARIMDQMCEAGIVGEEEGTKPRKVLMTLEELDDLM